MTTARRENLATKLLDLLLFGRAPEPDRERFVLRIAPGCGLFRYRPKPVVGAICIAGGGIYKCTSVDDEGANWAWIRWSK